jgi:hypothetical protein
MAYYKGKQVEVVSTSGSLSEVRYVGDPDYKTFHITSESLGDCVVNHRTAVSRKVDSVLAAMAASGWSSLDEISRLSGYKSLTGLSACIRTLRKPEMGSYVIDTRKRADGIFEYRLSQ